MQGWYYKPVVLKAFRLNLLGRADRSRMVTTYWCQIFAHGHKAEKTSLKVTQSKSFAAKLSPYLENTVEETYMTRWWHRRIFLGWTCDIGTEALGNTDYQNTSRFPHLSNEPGLRYKSSEGLSAVAGDKVGHRRVWIDLCRDIENTFDFGTYAKLFFC